MRTERQQDGKETERKKWNSGSGKGYGALVSHDYAP